MNKDSYYLDYNATSPLVRPVIDHLAKGDLPFANPASTHTLGRASKKIVNDSKKYIQNLFELNQFNLIFHSGASEWINTIFNLKEGDSFFYFVSDHAAVTEVAIELRKRNVSVYSLELDSSGHFDLDAVIAFINKNKGSQNNWLNFTYVHNETGVIWNLEDAVKIKDNTGALINIDAVQSVGKIENWNSLTPKLDSYTFSSHKFGAPKSFGFSFVSPSLTISPLIHGGSQQDLRSGTQDPLNIYLTRLALEYNFEMSCYKEALSFRFQLETILKSCEEIEIIAEDSKRASNTIGLIYKKETSDLLSAKFDMMGLFVSRGSACSSASLKESATLVSMGYSQFSTSFIRISFSPLMNFDQEGLLLKIKNLVSTL